MEEELKQFYIDLFAPLPRCGPGSVETTRKAFSFLKSQPKDPKILDIGAGTGMSTIELAKISDGKIIAIDIIHEYLDILKKKASINGIDNIETVKMSMDSIEYKDETFDILWSEGSIFVIGFEEGIKSWKRLLKPEGYLAVSDMVWFNKDAPIEVIEFWDSCYPQMLELNEAIEMIKKYGYNLIANFKFQEDPDWWENLYIPLEKHLPEVKKKYSHKKEFLAEIEFTEQEINFFKKYSNFYGYMFYIMQK